MKNSVRKLLIAGAISAAVLSGPSTAIAQSGDGQSFKVPDSPFTLLTQISLTGLSGSGAQTANPFRAEIYAFDGSSTVGPALYSASLGTGFSSGFFAGPNVNLTAGGSYLLIVTAPAVYNSRTILTSADVGYADGAAQSCSFGMCTAFANGIDVQGFSLKFAATATTVTPEPGTWMLSGVGLLAIGIVSRRRNKRSV